MEYPIYALVRPKGMSVSAISNVFNIYEYNNDFGFEYEIDEFAYTPDKADDNLLQDTKQLNNWLQNQSGKIQKQIHSMVEDENKESVDLSNIRLESESNREFEEARKKGKEIKDICNQRK